MIKWNFNGNRDLASQYRGEAVRLLHQLKMGIQPALFRSFPDGTLLSIIRGPVNDIVNIVSPFPPVSSGKELVVMKEKDLLFLYYIGGYAVWEIKRDILGAISLTPFQFSLNDYIVDFTPYSNLSTSTTQSNDEYNEHRVMIEDTYTVRYIGAPISVGYGRLCEVPSPYLYTLLGLRNSYVPIDWNADSVKTFEESLAYLSYAIPPASNCYLCSGRHNFMVYEDVLMKNLEVWEDHSIPMVRVEYDNSSGHQIETRPTWPTAFSDNYYIWGIITPDDYIGRSLSTSWHYSSTGWTGYPPSDYHLVSTYSYGFMFGDIFIDDAQISSAGYIIDRTNATEATCPGPPPTNIITAHQVWQYIQSSGVVGLIDYDHIDNDNQTFICFYTKQYYGTHIEAERVGVVDWDAYYWNGHSSHGVNKLFMLVYRLNGGVVIKETIAKCYFADVLINWVPHGSSPCDGYNTVTTYNEFHGQRMVKVTSKIANGLIFYSYVIQNYIGPIGDAHLADMDDVLWEFDSRVIGVIDIETGTHTKNIVNDEFLGSYINTFNEELASAIGFHHMIKEVTL